MHLNYGTLHCIASHKMSFLIANTSSIIPTLHELFVINKTNTMSSLYCIWQIRLMCYEFISNPNAIILAVTGANQDIGESRLWLLFVVCLSVTSPVNQFVVFQIVSESTNSWLTKWLVVCLSVLFYVRFLLRSVWFISCIVYTENDTCFFYPVPQLHIQHVYVLQHYLPFL